MFRQMASSEPGLLGVELRQRAVRRGPAPLVAELHALERTVEQVHADAAALRSGSQGSSDTASYMTGPC
jgi:hypothetical protein